MSSVDVSVKNDILDTNEKVFGIIYIMENKESGLNYVGQTVSHRKNKGKYRPFGMEGRFNDHVSEAINNTKKKQCSYLNNAIRKYGKDAFSVRLLEVCPCNLLDEREQFYIQQFNSLFPNGYNLTKGGKTTYIETFIGELETPKVRGGCKFRSSETRSKMSNRLKEMATEDFCKERAELAKSQHNSTKFAKFKNCKVCLDRIETYLRKKGKVITVTIDGISANFTSKHETLEQSKERAIEFIKQLHNATLSN